MGGIFLDSLSRGEATRYGPARVSEIRCFRLLPFVYFNPACISGEIYHKIT